ncbi:ZIP family metal transporter [Conexibacter sp. JD483]|uniref:ZIP family metal transporter n=1 Tax=unclassified Conexibacter TaxID=2627773 RepID=UPI00271B2D0F|nr:MULTISPECIES: ZIP family metal transporter [unclassified Conexibacter]MDO8187319.1 ZIP family metal transporter [Conexibacter sp. CPCC 205706]MDO8200548.1 ZIP family metal transporter [Conexibacter sp. CPCC 205762]MDR9369983.1 ZIP family metal transporter [Conexibacter sp. JD483]
MSAAAPAPAAPRGRAPVWLLAVAIVAVIGGVLAVLALAGGDTLPERRGPPVEELAVERTVLKPGTIELTLRNTGPDAVAVAQVSVNDAFVDFERSTSEIGRLGSAKLTIDYPWQEGSPYAINLLTSTGAVIPAAVAAAVETPADDGSFFALMALLGLYVGVIPVTLGMLFLPLLRRSGPAWTQVLIAFTVGLLAFLVVDGALEAFEAGGASGGAFGGPELLFLGAGLSFLVLSGLDAWTKRRRAGAAAGGASPARLALLIAVGIGLHNFGEGLAIGSAYALGALALGAFLVVGFALHNTTEGLAIVTPFAGGRSPSPLLLVGLGVVAGAPAILGAVIGATVGNAELSSFLLGIGVGAIVQVVVQLAPAMRDADGRLLHPRAAAGVAAGALALYGTSLLVAA